MERPSQLTRRDLILFGAGAFLMACQKRVTQTPTIEGIKPIATLVVPNTPTTTPDSSDVKQLIKPLPEDCELFNSLNEAFAVLSPNPITLAPGDHLKMAQTTSEAGMVSNTIEYLKLALTDQQISEKDAANLLVKALERNAVINKQVAARSTGGMANAFNNYGDCSQIRANRLKQVYDIK